MMAMQPTRMRSETVSARAAPTTVQSSFAKGVSLRAPRAAAVSTQRVSLSVVAGESRIGKNPCKVPAGVTVTLKEQHLSVKGKLGELSRSYPDEILLVQEGDEIKVTKRVETRKSRQLHGLCRTLTNNMLEGVSTGWSKKLLLIGVGYRAAVQGNKLTLNLGYSNPVVMEMPPSISATVEANTTVTISGPDRA